MMAAEKSPVAGGYLALEWQAEALGTARKWQRAAGFELPAVGRGQATGFCLTWLKWNHSNSFQVRPPLTTLFKTSAFPHPHIHLAVTSCSFWY
jgi:hypothetical protein